MLSVIITISQLCDYCVIKQIELPDEDKNKWHTSSSLFIITDVLSYMVLCRLGCIHCPVDLFIICFYIYILEVCLNETSDIFKTGGSYLKINNCYKRLETNSVTLQ